MHVDIAICTWNRAALLDQTLASMRELVIPAGIEWQVLVVNNHCTDDTDQVLAKHADDLPLRRLWEPNLGKSNALNTAIDTIEGELILWTDDDVLVNPDWLGAHVDAANRYPDASFFGGPIEPWFETGPPLWVTTVWNQIALAFATRDFGNDEFKLSAATLPFGANLAIRADVQRRFRYNRRLGRVGPTEVRGEETVILKQLLAAGYGGYWIPQARLRHFIPNERISLEYLERFFYGIGQTSSLDEEDFSGWFQLLLRLQHWTKASIYGAQFQAYHNVARPTWSVKKLIRASYHRGAFDGVEVPQAERQVA